MKENKNEKEEKRGIMRKREKDNRKLSEWREVTILSTIWTNEIDW